MKVTLRFGQKQPEFTGRHMYEVASTESSKRPPKAHPCLSVLQRAAWKQGTEETYGNEPKALHDCINNQTTITFTRAAAAFETPGSVYSILKINLLTKHRTTCNQATSKYQTQVILQFLLADQK